MCLAIIALNTSPDWPLIVVANRDELHTRPTLPAAPWTDAQNIVGGRDLNAGGTWLGMTANGRFALLTNFREPGRHDLNAPSRGQLTDRYLKGDESAESYAKSIREQGRFYNGFNLLIADDRGCWYVSNRASANTPQDAQKISPGVVGISNASLNTPWPKLKRTQHAVSELLVRQQTSKPDPERLFEIMMDTRSASLDELPDTGVGPEREKLLGSPFIKNERYGTRCTTLIMKRSDGRVRFHELRFDPQGKQNGESIWLIDTQKQKIQLGSAGKL